MNHDAVDRRSSGLVDYDQHLNQHMTRRSSETRRRASSADLNLEGIDFRERYTAGGADRAAGGESRCLLPLSSLTVSPPLLTVS